MDNVSVSIYVAEIIMNAIGFFRAVSYVTASSIFVLGILGVTGWFVPSYFPEKMRMMIGGAMMLWGIFRIVTIRFRQRQIESDNDNEE